MPGATWFYRHGKGQVLLYKHGQTKVEYKYILIISIQSIMVLLQEVVSYPVPVTLRDTFLYPLRWPACQSFGHDPSVKTDWHQLNGITRAYEGGDYNTSLVHLHLASAYRYHFVCRGNNNMSPCIDSRVNTNSDNSFIRWYPVSCPVAPFLIYLSSPTAVASVLAIRPWHTRENGMALFYIHCVIPVWAWAIHWHANVFI